MYRGWMAYGGVEVANTSRAAALVAQAAQCGSARGLRIRRRDDWEGFAAWHGDADYADIANAPWHNPADPESAEFLGIWNFDVRGLDAVPVQREVMDSIGPGGSASYHRDKPREIAVTAVLLAATNAGVRYGLRWLACQLRSAASTGGAALEFLAASPAGSAADPDRLYRQALDVVLVREPQVTAYGIGHGGQEHRQGTVLTVEYTLTAANPYLFGAPTTTPVSWASDAELPITWATGCADGGTCPEPAVILQDPLCAPALLASPPAPDLGCASGACLPLCGGRRRRWALPHPAGGGCGGRVVTVTVTNSTASDVRGVTLAWVPAGGDLECDRAGEARISWIPAGGQIVLDGMRSRAYAYHGGPQRLAVPAVVTGPGGAPWRPALLSPAVDYELVADTGPGVNVAVTVETRGRDA